MEVCPPASDDGHHHAETSSLGEKCGQTRKAVLVSGFKGLRVVEHIAAFPAKDVRNRHAASGVLPLSETARVELRGGSKP